MRGKGFYTRRLIPQQTLLFRRNTCSSAKSRGIISNRQKFTVQLSQNLMRPEQRLWLSTIKQNALCDDF